MRRAEGTRGEGKGGERKKGVKLGKKEDLVNFGELYRGVECTEGFVKALVMKGTGMWRQGAGYAG